MKKEAIFKKGNFKGIAMVLVIAIIIGVVINKNMFRVKASESNRIDFGSVYSEKIVDGVRYVISNKTENGDNCVYIRKSDTKDFTKLYIDNNTISKEVYTYNAGDIDNITSYQCEREKYNTDVYDDVNTDIVENNEENDTVDSKKIVWNKAVKTRGAIGIQYWYKKGNEGKKVYK
ncbi:MAG: hypothetical protein E7262_06165 [Lachnospiraceae bacterium]|nr:hypothetical protein [Lachnospiraceae bacterium]